MSSNNFVLNSTDGTYVNDITFTASDVNHVWFPYYLESTWLPYDITPYKPEYHIKLGYKNLIKNTFNL